MSAVRHSSLRGAEQELRGTESSDGLIIIAREQGPGGNRVFEVRDVDSVEKEISDVNATGAFPALYEVAVEWVAQARGGFSCVWLDIEWEAAKQADEKVEQARVTSIVFAVTESVRKNCGGEPIPIRCTKLCSTGRISPTRIKHSWHVILRYNPHSLRFMLCSHVRDIVREAISSLPASVRGCVDTGVYSRAQCFRMMGCAKLNDPKRFLRLQGGSPRALVDTLIAPSFCTDGLKMVPQETDPAHCEVKRWMRDLSAACLRPWNDARGDAAELTNDRYLVVPLQGHVRPCPVLGKPHRSNHLWASVDTKALRWRVQCHDESCVEADPPWQPVPEDAFLAALPFCYGPMPPWPPPDANMPPAAATYSQYEAADAVIIRRTRDPSPPSWHSVAPIPSSLEESDNVAHIFWKSDTDHMDRVYYLGQSTCTLLRAMRASVPDIRAYHLRAP
jgi:hypothetical protein